MNDPGSITPIRRTPQVQRLNVCRSSIEEQIERLIAILDLLDGDPDLEPELGWTSIGEGHRSGEIADAYEPNGDELDTSGDVEEAGIFETKGWTGQGTSEAEAMLSRLYLERRVSA